MCTISFVEAARAVTHNVGINRRYQAGFVLVERFDRVRTEILASQHSVDRAICRKRAKQGGLCVYLCGLAGKKTCEDFGLSYSINFFFNLLRSFDLMR